MNIARSLVRYLGHRSFLRTGLKHRIITRFHNPNEAKSESFTTQFFGLNYEGNFNSYIDWCIYYLGAYSRHELLFLESLARQLPPAAVMIDVGANVGNHSLFAATVFGHVYSFEPVPWLVERLKNQQTRNAITNMHVFPYALGDADGIAEFYSSTMANQGMGTLIKDREKNVQVIEVAIKRGDNFLRSIGVDRVDVIKIDVEGFERAVLAGLSETISRHQPIVFFEWSEPQLTDDLTLMASPFFDQYVFFAFTQGRTFGLFFEENTYRLTRVDALKADNNYVAVPSNKLHLIDN